ncbi:MAG TPA: hypothetical protein VGM37_03445 [Armatimonadota bacterium]
MSDKQETQETPETPEAAPMNRAERRHLAKQGGSPDKLHDFRNQQRSSPAQNVGPIPAPVKRGAVHRKTGS